MSTGDRPRADDALVVALAGGASHQEAAASAGISVSTVTRRLRDPGFRARLDAFRAEALAAAADRLAAATLDAVAVLVDVATDTTTSPAARVTAAARILDQAVRLHEHADLVGRLDALEALLDPLEP